MTAATAFADLKVRKHPRKAAAEIMVRKLRILVTNEGIPGANYDVESEQEHIDALEGALRADNRCIRCGTPLQDPESVERGIGPDCWAREQERNRAFEGPPTTEGATPCP
jgi:Family of unknown function (DUF6011)